MPHPPAPWSLQGYALQTVQLVPCDRLRPLLPPELEIISVLPNFTVGGLYLSSYGSGSVLHYNELIVAAGLVRRASEWGIWISHIYVDNLDSVAGGRQIWGLPKEMAEFSWQMGNENRVTVRQGDRLLCDVRYSRQLPLWRQQISGAAFSTLNAELLRFTADAEANFNIVNARVIVPPESPFSTMELNKPLFAASAESLQLVIHEPTVVGQKVRAGYASRV